MRVLTVFAHPSKKSFCHAVLERFDAGLRDAGHTNEIVDLYAIGFDPVLRERDNPNWMDANGPDDILAKMHLRERILEGARGPFRKFALKQLLGDRDTRGIIRLLQERYRPKDILVQQQKVANAQALAFIAMGERLASCDADQISVKCLASLPLPLQEALQPLVSAVESVTVQIHQYDNKIAQIARSEYPETARLAAGERSGGVDRAVVCADPGRSAPVPAQPGRGWFLGVAAEATRLW